ncbi:MAG: hypothetical protein GYA17_05240 [Chloroflexi bacterium]|nr:hypothetical protein [Chloroflexota bacterium]
MNSAISSKEFTSEKVINKAAFLSITAKEWLFPLAVTALILAVTSLPYIFAVITAPDGKQFMGMMLDVPDHLQYFSWMREFSDSFLSANKLTPEANAPVFFNLLWWILGRLGKYLNLGYAGVFQILRVVGTSAFLMLGYAFSAVAFPDVFRRRVTFLILSLSSGFGWVLIVAKYLLSLDEVPFPLDLYVAEGNTFLGILGYPHFIAAAVYVLTFLLVLYGQRTNQLRYAFLAGFFVLFMGWQHAYDLWLVYGVLLGYALLVWARDRALPLYLLKSGIVIGLISVWPGIYSFLLTSLDPLWKEVLKQFANAGVYTPNLLHLPILMGAAFLMAIAAMILEKFWRLKGVSNERLFFRAWFLVNFLLIYLPTDYQIHMLNGWQVPMAVLAVVALFDHIYPWLLRHRTIRSMRPATLKNLLAAGMLALVLPTNLYLLVWRFVELDRHDYPYYLYTDEISGMDWIEDHAHPDDVVLSSLNIGQYIPALTGTHAFLAHWAQTVDFYTKTSLVDTFYSGQASDAERLKILIDYGVDYVYYGPAEQALGDFNPSQAGYLEQTFDSTEVRVYRVK